MCIYLQSLLALLFSGMLTTQPVQASPFKHIGAAVLLGAAATALGYYLWSETDEQACDSAKNALFNASLFDVELDNFCALHHITHPFMNAMDIFYTEDELWNLDGAFVQQGITGYKHIKHLDDVIQTLYKLKKNLKYRIKNARNQESSYGILKKMESLHKKIKKKLPYLELYHNFLYAHRTYFTLFEYLGLITTKYKQENIAYTNYAYDPIRLAYGIKQAVGSHTHLYGQYKLIAYRQMLDEDISTLQTYNKNMHKAYPKLYTLGSQWEDFFRVIRGVIIADPDYKQELIDQQWQRDWEEQNRIAKREVEALEAKNNIELAKLVQKVLNKKPDIEVHIY